MFNRLLYLTQVVVACGNTIVYNWTPSWSNHDNAVYEDVKRTGCNRMYKGKAPCLTRFYKVKENTYHAMCGTGAFNARDTKHDKSIWQYNRRTNRWSYDAVASSKTTTAREEGSGTNSTSTRLRFSATPGTR